LKLLAQILDVAIEDELLDRANPARGRNQRVKATKPQRTWVEPEQLPSLIDAAGTYMRPVVAVLAGAGLRVGAVALNWRDVSLATGVLRVGRAKTAAGEYREVDLPGGLIEALSEWKARTPCREQDDPAFVSRSRRRQTVTNADHRLKTAIRAANRELTEAGIEPIGEKVSPHSLRRTYASLRAGSGTIPSTSPSRVGGPIRRSCSACIRRPRSGVGGLRGRTLRRSIQPAIGH
jgi:integrase